MSQTLYRYSEDAPKTLSEVLLVELHKGYCRENGTLAPIAANMPIGAVLARDDNGNYVAYLAAAGDNEALAVLVDGKDKNSAAQRCVVLRRGAKVRAEGLAFLESVTDEQKQTAYTQLTDLGIVVEE